PCASTAASSSSSSPTRSSSRAWSSRRSELPGRERFGLPDRGSRRPEQPGIGAACGCREDGPRPPVGVPFEDVVGRVECEDGTRRCRYLGTRRDVGSGSVVPAAQPNRLGATFPPGTAPAGPWCLEKGRHLMKARFEEARTRMVLLGAIVTCGIATAAPAASAATFSARETHRGLLIDRADGTTGRLVTNGWFRRPGEPGLVYREGSATV